MASKDFIPENLSDVGCFSRKQSKGLGPAHIIVRKHEDVTVPIVPLWKRTKNIHGCCIKGIFDLINACLSCSVLRMEFNLDIMSSSRLSPFSFIKTMASRPNFFASPLWPPLIFRNRSISSVAF